MCAQRAQSRVFIGDSDCGLAYPAHAHTNRQGCRSIKKERIKASQQANAPPELPLKVFVLGATVGGGRRVRLSSCTLLFQLLLLLLLLCSLSALCSYCSRWVDVDVALIVDVNMNVYVLLALIVVFVFVHVCVCELCFLSSQAARRILCPLSDRGLYPPIFFLFRGWPDGWLAVFCSWSGHTSLFSCCHAFMINLESDIETLTSSSPHTRIPVGSYRLALVQISASQDLFSRRGSHKTKYELWCLIKSRENCVF